ncbi:MAG: hypothetical protein AABX35_02515 [Nanoarchaeota archaeon]
MGLIDNAVRATDTFPYSQETQKEKKHAFYAAMVLMGGLIAAQIYFGPIVNEKAHLSLDPAIRQYDLNRNGKFEASELELIAKDLRKLLPK